MADNVPSYEDTTPVSSSNNDVPKYEDTEPHPAFDEKADLNKPVKTADDLMRKGYLFDDYWKLPPEEKQKYDALIQDQMKKEKTGLGMGIETGFPKVAGIGSKTLAGLQGEAERVIGNALGDDKTKEMYANTPQEQLNKPYEQSIEQAQKDNPTAFGVGQGLAALPAAIGLGGAVGAGTKAIAGAAELSPLATRGVQAAGNVLTGGTLGEAQGIAQSNAPTLAGKASEAAGLNGNPDDSLYQTAKNVITSPAGIGAGTAGAFEAGAAALTPEGQQAISGGIKNARDVFARRSLGGTAADQAGLKQVQGAVGEAMFPEGSINSPIVGYGTTKSGAAANAQAAKNIQGKAIENSLANIDRSASEKLAEEQSTTSFQKADADVPAIEPSAMEDSVTETPVNPDETANTEAPKAAEQTSNVPVEQVLTPDVENAVNQKITQAPAPIQQKISQIVNPQSMAQEIEAEVMPKFQATNDPANVLPKIDEQLSKFAGIKNPDLKTLFKYRMQLDDVVYANQTVNATGQTVDTPVSGALKDYRTVLDKKLMEAAKQVDQLTGANSFEALQNAKAKYSVLSRINRVAQRGANQQESALAKSAPLAIGGGVVKGGAMLLGKAAAASNPMVLGGAVAGIAAKKYGNQFAANSLNALKQLVESGSPVLADFTAPLQDAAKRGTTALAAMHYALYSSDEKYRNIIDPLQEESEKQSNP